MRGAGYSITSGPDGTVERDTFTCSHCQLVVYVAPRQDPSELGGFCRGCMKHICKRCNKASLSTVGCVPFMKAIDLYEKKQAASAEILRAAGLA